MPATTDPWLFELTYLLREFPGGTLAKLADLAETLPDDPGAVFDALRDTMLALRLPPGDYPAQAARQAMEDKMRQAVTAAGDIGAKLVGRLLEKANQLLRDGMNDPADPAYRLDEFGLHFTTHDEFSIGFVSGLPVGHALLSAVQPTLVNGQRAYILGRMGALFYRESGIRHLTAAETDRQLGRRPRGAA